VITVGFLPWWSGNPYQPQLKHELEALGVRVIGNPHMSLRRVLLSRDGLDVVHIHWPHGLYRNSREMFWMLLTLVAYRLLRNNIVWTVHELDAYESLSPRRDALFRAMVMKLSRRLLVHGEHTRRLLQTSYGYSREIDCVKHPSYIGSYKDETDRERARARLGLPQRARVFLYLGCVKPYKGVEDLIESFRQLRDESAVLVVAGMPLNAEMKERIETLSNDDSRIRLSLDFVPDDDIQYYFHASDVVVLPFRYTQTSGSLVLALSYGRPVVAPGIATIPEYLGDDRGIMFDPAKPGDLARALAQCAQAPLAAMGENARRFAQTLRWDVMARIHRDVYRAVVEPR
jgi:beta-1,4-mannosyltransferase